jgi:hypothetical protein
MRSFSENAPSDETIQRMNTRFLCTKVAVQQFDIALYSNKNDTSSDGTFS